MVANHVKRAGKASFDTILYNVRVGRLISMPSLVVTKTVSHMKRWTYKQWRTQLM